MTEPAIITCAVIGGALESANPNRPTNFDEIVESAVGGAKAGAAILHLHARTRDGTPTQDPDVYREMVDAIRSEAPDVVLNFTLSGTIGMDHEERLRALEAGPEIGTLDCGSLNLDGTVWATSPEVLERATAAMKEAGVRPELECLEPGWVCTAARLWEDGHVADPPFMQIMLGVGDGAPPRVDTLLHMASLIPREAVWAATAIGPAHFRVMAVALALGAHVRTGLEDVAHLEDGRLAESNAELVARAVRLAEAIGRPVATPAEAREILRL
jgi:3-keto-5-aminohexanoate cleavage enzyme